MTREWLTISNILLGAASVCAIATVGLAVQGWWAAAILPAAGTVAALVVERWWMGQVRR